MNTRAAGTDQRRYEPKSRLADEDIRAEKILILDFGSQYTQLIARRVRELKVYCEIHPYHIPLERVRAFGPKGIILSGSPASVYDDGAPLVSRELLNMGVPVLGICYGMQLITHLMKGEVEGSSRREYGYAELTVEKETELFQDIEGRSHKVWMSHGDHVVKLPEGFVLLASSQNSPISAFRDLKRPIFGVQFHPEVAHTPCGTKVLENFLYRICGCRPTWTMKSFIRQAITDVRSTVGPGQKVLCALSGGVDSAVTASLIHKAIGDDLYCIFVDNGLLRKGEAEKVVSLFKSTLHMNLIDVDAKDRFLQRLEGIEDPEEKRKIIGAEFIRIFEKEAQRIGRVHYLAQGTLYPDVIESISLKGPSATIKSHHNVGGLPEMMNLALIEPLRELFKDEVRDVGRELGLPAEIIKRQPFPGPGLAVRILGAVSRDRLEMLREADAIVEEEFRKAGLYDKLWQSFAVLLPVRTVGVMGDERTYEHVIALRAVESLDGMTADWVRLPHELLQTLSNRIINEVKGVNRVVYDISSKPPSTIEWE